MKDVTIKNTGIKGVDLNINTFHAGGKKGPMVQVTQGFAGSPALSPAEDEPGFIQLTTRDMYFLVIELTKRLKENTSLEADKIKEKIANDKALQKTIFRDAVDCEHFIADLKIIEIPLRLLST